MTKKKKNRKKILECFWCLKKVQKRIGTKDHLVPKAIGGNKDNENLRFSCKSCNQLRGRLPNFYKNTLQLIQRMNKWHDDNPNDKEFPPKIISCVERFCNESIDVKQLFMLWRHIEIERLGFSPSESMPFVWDLSTQSVDIWNLSIESMSCTKLFYYDK